MEINKWYQQAADTVIEQLKVEFSDELLGILLSRSLARDLPLKQSDLDIYVIVRSSYQEHRAIVVSGVNIQVWIYPTHQIHQNFQSTDTPAIATLEHFANGHILYDPERIMSHLVRQAQYIWQQPTPAIPTQQLQKLCRTLITQLKDAQDLLEGDEVAATFAMFSTLVSALDIHYKLQRRWTVQPINQLRDLHEHAPELESLIRCILSRNISMKQRFVYLSQLVDRTLTPIGGKTLEEWKMATESVVC